jgi:hypothetical protein
MRKLSLMVLALLVASAGNAFAQDVRYNFDKDANFASFKTYKWVPIKGAQAVNSLVDLQIKATIDAELAGKGLTLTDADTADLFVGYQVAVSTEKQYTSFDTGWGYGPGGRLAWHGGGTTTGRRPRSTSGS